MTARRTLYGTGLLVALVLLATGASLQTVLSVALVAWMLGMHLGGHGGHGGHGGSHSPHAGPVRRAG